MSCDFCCDIAGEIENTAVIDDCEDTVRLAETQKAAAIVGWPGNIGGHPCQSAEASAGECVRSRQVKYPAITANVTGAGPGEPAVQRHGGGADVEVSARRLPPYPSLRPVRQPYPG